MKALELIGKKFGRLTVIASAGRTKYGKSKWLCKCDCGNEKEISSKHFKNGDTKSCGCLRHEHPGMKPKEDICACSNLLFNNNYKSNAIRKGVAFELTLEEFIKITSSDCFYCGSKPSSIQRRQNHQGFYIYNGIDRVDNSIGYIKENVVPCCWECNSAKKTMSIEIFVKKSILRAEFMKNSPVFEKYFKEFN
jgi:hypothetical protein